MVRMILAASAAGLAMAGSLSAQDRQSVSTPMLWSFVSPAGAFYQLEREDARQSLRAGRITVWVVADHSRDRTVPYRKSRQQVTFDCDGAFRVAAFTSYMPNGTVRDDWQRTAAMSTIEQGTFAASLEEVLCG